MTNIQNYKTLLNNERKYQNKNPTQSKFIANLCFIKIHICNCFSKRIAFFTLHFSTYM